MDAKRVTSLDVAQQAGVSRTTVSLVLNNVRGAQISEETRQRVLESARELGYVPDAAAQSLASRRSQIIGLVLNRGALHIASDAFLTQFLDGLVEVARQNGMRVLIDLVEAQHQKETYLQLVRSRHIDGILLSGPRFDDEALQALEETGFPTVLNGQIPDANLCSVDVDNVAAARQATEYLLQLGHTHIACITNAQQIYTAAAERLQGYRLALESRALAFDERLVRYGDFSPQSGYEQMKSLLEREPLPTAAFVASDVVALGAMLAVRERGLRIPDDLSLVGFDNVPFARYVDPPLTTVHLPTSDLARRGGELLFQLIRGEAPLERRVLLDTCLVERQSCRAIVSAGDPEN